VLLAATIPYLGSVATSLEPVGSSPAILVPTLMAVPPPGASQALAAAATIPYQGPMAAILEPVGSSPVILVPTLVAVPPPGASKALVETGTTRLAMRASPPDGPPPAPAITVTGPSGEFSSTKSPPDSNTDGGDPETGTGSTGAGHEGDGPSGAILQDLLKFSQVPWSSDVEISDMLRASQPSLSYGIPVGPTTREFKMTVESSEEIKGPEAPMIDELYLISQSGSVLVALQGIFPNVPAYRQALDIALSNIPVGAKLVVRVHELPIGATSHPDPTTAAVDLAFKMEVQRNDPLGFLFPSVVGVATGTSSGLLTSGVNALYVPSTLLANASPRSDRVDISDGESATQAVPTEVAPVAEEVVTSSPGVSLGPLASLGGSPLGPALATSRDGLTASIDRNERAFDLAMEQWGADLDSPTAPAPARAPTDVLDRDRPMPNDDDRDEQSFLPLRGPGGLPVLVTATTIGRGQADRQALLATRIESDRDPEVAAARESAPLDLMGPPDRPEDESVACTDFLTAACGLVLGIGLATGPLYPDLIALVRTCLPRRPRLIARTAIRKGRRRPSRGLRGWLGI
jgi:hypothetical protein